jgi:O-antigen/teichoic acid export membrane protein
MEPVSSTRASIASRQIRGSSLLLVGRLLSVGLNFAIQLLIVRALSKTEYGAFEYALSIVALGETIATLGLDRAVPRYVPVYHEQGDYGRLFGTILLVLGAIVVLGVGMVGFVWAFHGSIARMLIQDRQAALLVVILIVLAPVQALDGLITRMLGIFANPRAIFFRQHILAPGLKLVVVVLLVLGRCNVFFLAVGYLAAGILGVGAYAVILLRVLRDQGLIQRFAWQSIGIPFRELLTFSVPLLTSDLLMVVRNTLNVMLLEHFRGAAEVAAFRAVQPAARLNELVYASFQVLYMPAVARLFAREDRVGIGQLYGQTAIWMATLSFPIFALTFSLARPLTLLLYGTRYADSAAILALLSFGYYLNAAVGHNNQTLRVLGRVRCIVLSDVISIVVNLTLSVMLIPRCGALGAALAVASALVVRNLVMQVGLRSSAGISLLESCYLRVYAVIAASALGLLLIQWLISPPVSVSVALTVVVVLLVVGLNGHSLNVGQTFPEIMRFSLVRRLLGKAAKKESQVRQGRRELVVSAAQPGAGAGRVHRPAAGDDAGDAGSPRAGGEGDVQELPADHRDR